MKARFFTFVLVALFGCCLSTLAQKNDLGVWLGGANYFGDINTETNFRFVNPAGGFFFRRNFDNRISARVNINGGRVWADDAYANNYYQVSRNLGFSSNIYEASAQLEFNFLPYSTIASSSLNAKHRFSPYVMAGFGLFHFNPIAKYNGEKVVLQPLGTEGQASYYYEGLTPYKRTSTAWLMGGGFKYRIGRLTGITIEGGVRKTSTDYLDDVSGVYAAPEVLDNYGGPMLEFLGDPSVEVVAEPVGAEGKMRGDSRKSDDYFFFGVGISYTLNPYRCPFPR